MSIDAVTIVIYRSKQSRRPCLKSSKLMNQLLSFEQSQSTSEKTHSSVICFPPCVEDQRLTVHPNARTFRNGSVLLMQLNDALSMQPSLHHSENQFYPSLEVIRRGQRGNSHADNCYATHITCCYFRTLEGQNKNFEHPWLEGQSIVHLLALAGPWKHPLTLRTQFVCGSTSL
jgi:hypothetical protein